LIQKRSKPAECLGRLGEEPKAGNSCRLTWTTRFPVEIPFEIIDSINARNRARNRRVGASGITLKNDDLSAGHSKCSPGAFRECHPLGRDPLAFSQQKIALIAFGLLM
jgi:hypothetical protein